ncbi:MAG: cobalamin-dependent protein [Spirochaetes bacterium]|nr:cobalamin-dependent protein [Spirochaetota bacterium]
MKILLAYLCHYQDRHDYYMSLLPVGLVSIAAYLQYKGHDVTLANFSKVGYRKAVKEICERKPDVLGISMFTHNRVDSIKLIQSVKKEIPKCTIVAGGPHVTFLTDEFLKRVPEIDYIVRGEGEKAFLRILEKLKFGRSPVSKVVEAEMIDHLETIPPPSSFEGEMIGVDPNEQFKHIITSRGCPFSCTFCCSPVFWGNRVRFTDPQRVVDELVTLYKKHGIIYFSIRDDNFTLRKSHAMRVSELLRKSGVFMMWNCQARVDTVDEEMLAAMKRAGLEMIQYGVETGSEKILRLYDKNITIADIKRAAKAARKVGTYLSLYLMAGMKGETHADVKKTISLIREILPGDGIVSPVALYPGTILYEKVRLDGGISNAVWFERKDSGIFLRDDEEVRKWIKEILTVLSTIREKSWYREDDFQKHRKVMGKECWVTDVLEGDFWLDEENYENAARLYQKVIRTYSHNPWGYLRMGKLSFRIGNFMEAERYFREVTKLVPAYYGGWLKLAESQVAYGNRHEARKSIAHAMNLNKYDIRIQHLAELLKKLAHA